MTFEAKRRKIDESFYPGILVSSNTKNGIAIASSNGSSVSATIQQAKKYFAATEAQKDGCTWNYRIFDSAFGNFLVPVVPTRAELTKTHGMRENPNEAAQRPGVNQVTHAPKALPVYVKKDGSEKGKVNDELLS
ncbi:hypothetical protein Lal_00046308 [Lupinus albus]|uniref:Uncharacterized protein n=1 Tax=Lupinus albus TaxID=3870 RepID=A0A6A4PFS8_LUPAL|nr:hypothetical protein Lalb_Chr14g0371911 [Lupinus albus]KAF1887070.1 hypothetical protein Lal_00046308 [Lupinus albus]